MAIVPSLGVDDLDEPYRALLERPINLFRALANSPEGFSKFQALAEWIRWESRLDARLRELVILQVGYLTRDPYEWSHHIELSRGFGVTPDDIRGLVDLAEGRPSSLGETEVLVLTATAQLTHRRSIDNDLVSALTARFSAEELTDIVLAAAFYSMVVRVLGGLRVEVEPEYQPYLEEFPLPPSGGDQ